jgi:hypothetical protein
MSVTKAGHKSDLMSAMVERVVGLTEALAQNRPGAFDQGIGVSEDCLSSQKFYELLMGGATQEDRKHLMSCFTCRENLALLSQVRLQSRPDFIAQVLENARNKARQGVTVRELADTRLPAPAILACEDSNVGVDPKSKKKIKIVFDLIPGFPADLLKDVDLNSFKIEGALQKPTSLTAELVDFDRDERPDSVRVEIGGASLAPSVLKSILNHQRVIDTVRLRGRFSKGPRRGFAAQANLQFYEKSGGA